MITCILKQRIIILFSILIFLSFLSVQAHERFFSDEGAVWLGNPLHSFNIFETIMGDTLTYCRSYAGVYVFDIDYETAEIEFISFLPTYGRPEDTEGWLAIFEPYVYICTNSGMFFYDTSNPFEPVQTRPPLNAIYAPAVKDSVLYVYGTNYGVGAVEAYDLRANPGNPALIDTFITGGSRLIPYENHLIVDNNDRIQILEFQDNQLVEVAYLEADFGRTVRSHLTSNGRYYRLSHPNLGTFYEVFDVSTPEEIELIGRYNFTGPIRYDFEYLVPYAVINLAENIDAFSNGELSVIMDVTDPINPVILDTLKTNSQWTNYTSSTDNTDSSFVMIGGHAFIVIDVITEGTPGNEEYSLEFRYQERGPVPFQSSIYKFHDDIFHETQLSGLDGMNHDNPLIFNQYVVNEFAGLDEILTIDIPSGEGGAYLFGYNSRRFTLVGSDEYHLFDLDVNMSAPVTTIEAGFNIVDLKLWIQINDIDLLMNWGNPHEGGYYRLYYTNVTEYLTPDGPYSFDLNGAQSSNQIGCTDTLLYIMSEEDSVFIFDMTEFPVGDAINVFYYEGNPSPSPIYTGADLLIMNNSVYSIIDPVHPEHLCELPGTISSPYFRLNWAIHDSGYVAGAGPDNNYALYDLRGAPDYEILATWRGSHYQGNPEECWWTGDTLWIDEPQTLSAYRFPAIDDIPVVNENGRNPYSPNAFELLNPYPNPFNSSTKISFVIHRPAPIQLSVYDILGRQVYFQNWPYLQPGRYSQTLNNPNLVSGPYFIQLNNPRNSLSATRKIVLIK